MIFNFSTMYIMTNSERMISKRGNLALQGAFPKATSKTRPVLATKCNEISIPPYGSQRRMKAASKWYRYCQRGYD